MSSRHALVMIVYFGHRWERKKENFVPYEDENDVYPMVQYQIESLKKLDPGVDTDIIIVNNSPNSERSNKMTAMTRVSASASWCSPHSSSNFCGGVRLLSA